MYKKRRVKASVSLFLTLTISIFLALAAVLIESARENTMLLQAETVLDTSVSSAMGEYHKVLWEEYGLLFLDCSYKSSQPSYQNLIQHIRSAADQNLGTGTGWLSMALTEASVSSVVLATDASGMVFYQRSVEAAKAETGIGVLEQLLSNMTTVEDLLVQGETILGMGSSLDDSIEEANGLEIEISPEEWGYDEEGNYVLEQEAEYEQVDITSPLQAILDTSEDFILTQAVADLSRVSSLSVDLSEVVSGRSLAVGQGTFEEEGEVTDRLFFLYYLDTYMGNYSDPAANGSLQYSMEYILAGKDSDRKNLAAAVSRIFLIRIADNFMAIQQDAERTAAAEVSAAAVTFLVPYLQPVMKQALLLYWSYEDSIEDMQTLLAGGKVQLLKSINLVDLELDYEQYLMILLFLTGRENLSLRTMDLIELNVRQTDGNEDFHFDACIDSCLVGGIFEDSAGKIYSADIELHYY
ncbi:MAG: DUF5702 domain-containing protein [Lachnospiraceae bacterium]|nr:DUF5702 domain-containing protein [Lachnospiraceae bacterium]